MSGIGTGYDLSGTTYSPDGRVFQAEYACKAVDNAGTTIGVKCSDGVLCAVEKQVESKMVVAGSASSRRIMACDRHAGIACAGLAPDGRQLVNRARCGGLDLCRAPFRGRARGRRFVRAPPRPRRRPPPPPGTDLIDR